MKIFDNKYFYFNKKERKGILVLNILTLIILLLNFLIPVIYPKQHLNIESFNKILSSIESLPIKKSYNNQKKNYFNFNPNILDSIGWIKLGLSPKQYIVINNYRLKGGQFRSKDDLKKIFVISDEFFHNVESFIQIPPRKKRIQQKRKIKKEIIPIEINSADSASLDQLPGIGPAFAKRILKYRNLLGGFTSNKQLLEVYGMDNDRFNSFRKLLKEPDTSLLIRINIQTSEYKKLIKHPYISKRLTKFIINTRTREDLNFKETMKAQEFITDSLFKRLLPYLKFN